PFDSPPAPTPPPDEVTPPPEEPDPVSDSIAEGVRMVVQNNMGAVKRCYSRAAKVGTKDEPLEGKIELEFTVHPSGDVTDVGVVSNDTGSDQLADCVGQLIQSWRFPAPEEDMDFVWPFVFKAPR